MLDFLSVNTLLKVRATFTLQVSPRFGHQTVKVQSATEVEVLDEVSQGYCVQSDDQKKNPIAEAMKLCVHWQSVLAKHQRYHEAILPSVLALATLDSTTQIGSFLFVSHCPRSPGKVQSRFTVAGAIAQMEWPMEIQEKDLPIETFVYTHRDRANFHCQGIAWTRSGNTK